MLSWLHAEAWTSWIWDIEMAFLVTPPELIAECNRHRPNQKPLLIHHLSKNYYEKCQNYSTSFNITDSTPENQQMQDEEIPKMSISFDQTGQK